MRAVCIDGNGAASILTEGKEYDVQDILQQTNTYRVLEAGRRALPRIGSKDRRHIDRIYIAPERATRDALKNLCRARSLL